MVRIMARFDRVLALNDPDPKEMSVVEHLDELRRRLIVCISVVTVGSVIGWFFKKKVLSLVLAPIRHPGIIASVHTLQEGFSLEIKISVIIGIALCLPVLLYESWMFVAPAVAPRSRHYVVPFVLVGIVMFLIGGLFGYLLFPRLSTFLIAQAEDLGLTPVLTVGDYVGTFALVIIVFGAVFELPVILNFLALIGVVSSRWLRSKRKFALMIGLVSAMIITPGADPFTPFVTAGIVYLLYEMSIISVRLLHR
jgi:sec-independent protein translocase protein TatC